MSDRDDVAMLTARLADGALSDGEGARLAAAMRGDAAAVEAYVTGMLTAALIQRELSRTRATMLMPAIGAAGASRGTGRWRLAAYAAAAAVLIAGAAVVAYLGVTSGGPSVDGGGEQRAIATVVGVDSSSGAPINAGDAMGRGPMPIASGSVELLMGSGAAVTLSGPGEFELVDPMRVSVTRGRAHCVVPPGAAGFTVAAPDGVRVVDLGTEFIIAVDERGRSSVGVVRGRVRVMRDGAEGAINQALDAGEAMIVADGVVKPAMLVQGTIVVESIDVDPQVFNATSNRDEDGDDPPGLAEAFTYSEVLADEAIEEAFGRVHGGVESANVMFADTGVADNGNGVMGDGDETVDFIEWRTTRPVTIGGYRVHVANDDATDGGPRSVRMLRLIVEGHTVDTVDAGGRHGGVLRLLEGGPVVGQRFRVEFTRGTAGVTNAGPRIIEIDAVNATVNTEQPPAPADRPDSQGSNGPEENPTQGDSR